MKTIELTVQEKEDFCVCSALQAILRGNGMEISQEEIARNLTKGKERGYLIDDEKIKKFMGNKGFIYACFGIYETPFNEPNELLKEMCLHDGIVGMNDHVYFVKDFHDPTVKLIDPKDGKETEKNYSDLLGEMGYDDFFGLIKRI